MIQKTEENLIRDLVPLVNYKIVYKKNYIIFHQDSITEDVLILLDGKVKLTHITPDGKELTLGVYDSKRIILSNFSNNNKNFISLFKMESLSNCTIGVISSKRETLNDKLKQELINYYDYFLQKIFLQLRDLIFNNNLCKLISILIRLSNSYGIKTNSGIKINIELNNIILSEYTACAPETISRLIKKLILLDVIEKENKFFIIKDIDFMKSKLKCSYCRNELCMIWIFRTKLILNNINFNSRKYNFRRLFIL